MSPPSPAQRGARLPAESAALRGLTWDHPRGYAPLEALGGPVSWDRQPLGGFESHPIADLADRYDLLVVDHPGIGEAAGAGCLTPMEELLQEGELEDCRRRTVGRCFESYRYGGRQWALPIDAATQVVAFRAGALAGPPRTWGEVVGLARHHRVCLPLAGPHALLGLFGICRALGGELLTERRAVPVGEGRRALRIMAALLDGARPEDWLLDPIGVLEGLASGGGAELCPLVYGYVTYARRGVAFADAPAEGVGGRPGGVLGGTGVAVSRRAGRAPSLVEYLRHLVAEVVQRGVFTAAGGQPAARAAWADPEIDAAWGGFYRATVASVEQAWVRPAYPGYVAFQAAGSAAVRLGLLEGRRPDAILGEVEVAYAQSRERGGGRDR